MRADLRIQADKRRKWLRRIYRERTIAHHEGQSYLRKHAPPISLAGQGTTTEVDEYWGGYTVNSVPFVTRRDSAAYLEWRFDEYPLFREFAHLWGDHDGEVVLDYGCGPGNDVTGFLLHTKAKRVIAIDISRLALERTRRRIALHRFDLDRVELIQSPDADPSIPLADDSVDYFQSMGVIHVTTDPGEVLKELHRVLKPSCTGRVMVYNQHSVWFHLYTAYVKMILEGKWVGLSVEEAFQKNTDGEDCPIARAYTPEAFADLCRSAGFDTEYVGGHLSKLELEVLAEHNEAAIDDERLDERHRDFLRELDYDGRGNPMWRGKHAGVGGVFELRS